jgi:uncharacterized membrane-anchored protein
MKMATVRRSRDVALPGISGVARLDRRTPRLLQRLNRGDVAVVDIADMDRASAEALAAAGVVAVVNAQPSISGRYPNLGPEVLISHGVALLDGVGAEVFSSVKEGTKLRLDGDTLFSGERQIAQGIRQDATSVANSMARAKEGMSAQLAAFAVSAQQHMEQEKDLLLDGLGLPKLRTIFTDRHVLLVTRSYDFKSDLKSL